MLAFYGSRISEHMTKTPEGFLICHDVPIARTGRQDYLPREVGQEGDRMIPVFRTEDEVFSTATLASFEGKPVTNDHPPQEVTAQNFGMYLKGHAQNVHRGHGDQADLLMADLFIDDAELIREIENGLREVSCGYECDYIPDMNGGLYQRRIRGNHIAIVAAGRAGSRVAIKDSMPDPDYTDEKRLCKGVKKPMSKNKNVSALARFFSGWATDRDPDEVAEAVDELIENGVPEDMPTDEEPAAPVAPAAPAAPEAQDCGMVHDDAMTELLDLMKKIAMKVGVADTEPGDELQPLMDELQDPNAPLPAEATDEDLPPVEEQEASVTVPAEEIDEDPTADPTLPAPKPANDSAVAMIKALRPYMAKLPAAERRKAADAMTAAYRQSKGMAPKATHDGVASIMNTRTAAAKARSTRKVEDEAQIGRDIMAKFNPHYKKN